MTRPLQDVSLKQAYEWIKTGKWTCSMFNIWLHAKGIDTYTAKHTAGGTLIHRASYQSAYEWIKTGVWSRAKFTHWMNSFL